MEYKLSVKYKEIKDEKTLNSVKESKIYIENADQVEYAPLKSIPPSSTS
ncbi:MAG: hypothetical protein ACK5NU_05095 [Fusobacterium ulcerans]